IESAVPLPAGATDAPDTPFSLPASETAEMLFAQLEGADEQAAQPRLVQYAGGKADPSGLEADSWMDGDALEDEPAGRQLPGRPPAVDEATRDTRTIRPESGLIRDAIPFAMIPYLPGRAPDMPVAENEAEESRDLAEDGE